MMFHPRLSGRAEDRETQESKVQERHLGHPALRESTPANAGLLLRLDEDFQVRVGVRVAADLGEKERINVASGRDEVQLAADSGLCWMDIAEVVRAVDDPEFFVARGEIEDLLTLAVKKCGSL